MINIFIRVLIIYILVLIVMRLMGKREIRPNATIWTSNCNNDSRFGISSNERYRNSNNKWNNPNSSIIINPINNFNYKLKKYLGKKSALWNAINSDIQRKNWWEINEKRKVHNKWIARKIKTE